MVYKQGKLSERCSLPEGWAALQPQLRVRCDLPSSQSHLGRVVAPTYLPLEDGTRAGFSTELFSCFGSLCAVIAAGGKPDQLHLAGQKESRALHRWPGRGLRGVAGKPEVGVHTERGKQAQVTWLVSGTNCNLRLRATLENTAYQSSPLKYAHIKAIWNEYLNAGLRRERTTALLTFS